MTDRENAFARHQQQRWLKPNAHLWIRPDAARYLQPGVDPADVHPALAIKRRREEEAARRLLAAQVDAEWAEIAAMQTQIAMLRKVQAAIRGEVARRGAARALKYSLSQPRVPRGRPTGGRWTKPGGGGGSLAGGDGGGSDSEGDGSGGPLGFADPMGNIDFGDLTGWAESDGLFGIAPSETDNGDLVQLVQDSGYPIDLREEKEGGGHTIEAHVGKSEEFLLARVRYEALRAQEYGFAEGLRVGSFPSLEAANKLVNATIAQNPAGIDRVVNGGSPKEALNAQFGSVTGYEAYAKNDRSQPYIRETFGVSVIVVPNPTAARRYRIETAFPRNFDR